MDWTTLRLGASSNSKKIWIKNSGSKLTFNLGQIYSGLKPLWKNLENSPKFYLDFLFMNTNLVCHVFMPKSGVSKHGPKRLCLKRKKGLWIWISIQPSLYYFRTVLIQGKGTIEVLYRPIGSLFPVTAVEGPRLSHQRGVGGIVYACGTPGHMNCYGTHRSDSPISAS
jgi:hypothetical protein